MKKDWFGKFLLLWMWGTIVWIGLGFYLLPTSFRVPVWGRSNDVYLGSFYDTSLINYEALWQFLVVIGVPNFLFLVVFTIFAVQHVRNKPKGGREPTRG